MQYYRQLKADGDHDGADVITKLVTKRKAELAKGKA